MFDHDAYPVDPARVRSARHFDADWYRATYPDVDMAGMDPAAHFIRYGAAMRRDPGPDFSTGFFLDTHPGRAQADPRRLVRALRGDTDAMTPKSNLILWAAQNVALQEGGADRAARLAKRHAPHNLAHTAHILQANAALRAGDRAAWLGHLNVYLAHYGLDPLRLDGDGPVFTRFRARGAPDVTGGPLISVIMPAWNAAETLDFAAGSILTQTWRNLELLIVDDCSTDATWAVMQRIAAADDRVRIMRNVANVGPYVSKNIALTQARGDWITGHDADDWALPQRLEKHIAPAIAQKLPASVTHMIRLQPDGAFSHIGRTTSFSPDGVARRASISCLFERGFIDGKLGFWDAVRFGADSEMIARAQRLLGDRFATLPQLSMLCLDLDTSLTNHPEHGLRTAADGGMSQTRTAYREAWDAWHAQAAPKAMRFDVTGSGGRYAVPAEMAVPQDAIRANLAAVAGPQ